MNTRHFGAMQKLRACGRTLFSLRPHAQTLFCFFASLVLCRTDFGLGRMPLGASLLAVCPKQYLAACTLGIAVGSVIFSDLQTAAAPLAVAAAVLCARILIPKKTQHLAVPAIAAGICALVEMRTVIEAQFSGMSALFLVCHITCIVGAIVLYRAALIQKNYPARVGALCTLLPGLAVFRLPGGWNAAVAVLAWTACAPVGPIYICAGCGILSVLLPQSSLFFASLCIGTLLARLFREKPIAANGIACGVYLLAGFLCRSIGCGISAAAGTLLSLPVPPERLLPTPVQAGPLHFPAQRELRQAAGAMRQAADMLQTPDAEPRQTMAVILDAASRQVCRNCAKNQICHDANGLPLDALFGDCAPAILARGALHAQDLPPQLRSRCIHPEAFLTAVNDALDAERSGQRIQRRLHEARRAAQAQYRLMGDLLEHLSVRLYAPDCMVNYTPEISVQAAGRAGSTVSGDRGAAFAGPGATYYVLLCDGMGAGAAAARESRQAVALLRAMLLSGADAGRALDALNGLYLLRDDGCFSTVDLLRINLTSADAILYKWGGSASYLKRSRGLRTLGGAGLPPGLDPEETFQQLHLNLDRGGVLVLLSDGLAGKETRQRLERCSSLTPQDVARSIFAGRVPGTDDCTAVVIRLRRTVQAEPVAI